MSQATQCTSQQVAELQNNLEFKVLTALEEQQAWLARQIQFRVQCVQWPPAALATKLESPFALRAVVQYWEAAGVVDSSEGEQVLLYQNKPFQVAGGVLASCIRK